MAGRRLSVLNRHLGKHGLKLVNCSAQGKNDLLPNELVYTLDGGALTMDQRLFYEKNGFIIIPDLVDTELLDACSSRFADLCEGRIPKGEITLMKDISLKDLGVTGEYLYNKAQDLFYDEVFSKYFTCEKLLDVVESFVGPNILGVNSMLINKPPDSGALTSRHPLHQDLLYLPIRPANRIVTSWTALEDATVENGCLFVIPGSHTGTLLKHEYPDWEGGVNKGFYGIKNSINDGLIKIPMKKGETVFFHPLLMHGSGPNLTKGFRKAMTIHYVSSSECHFIDVTGTVQEPIMTEFMEITQRRGFHLNYHELWRLKCNLLRGENISLI